MHLHILLFLAAFTTLTGLTLAVRSSWGVPLYMLTIYMSPKSASWGDPIDSESIRWTLIAAFIFAVGVMLDQRRAPAARPLEGKKLLLPLLFVYALNATAVHTLFAAEPEISIEGLTELWKRTGLVLLIFIALKDPTDVRIMLTSMVVGAGYVGREVVVNDSLNGEHDARLWVYIGSINGNHATVLLATSLPLGAYLLLTGSKLEKLGAAYCLIYTLETVVRCNSRAVWLGLIAGAGWMLLRSRQYRGKVMLGVALGVTALLVTSDASDMSQLTGRFESIFASEDERESSAASRIVFWKAGLEMIADYPLGLGAEAAFNSDLGNTYIEGLGYGENRSVHQGYLDMAASWGIQGLCLYLAALTVVFGTFLTRRDRVDPKGRFLGVTLEVMLIIQLVTAFFGVNLASDSAYWILALAVASNGIAPATEQKTAYVRTMTNTPLTPASSY